MMRRSGTNSSHRSSLAPDAAWAAGFLLVTLGIVGTWVFFMVWMFINPLLFWWETADWQPVPCEIVRSTTREVGPSMQHVLQVTYAYEHAGERRTAERFHPLSTSTLGSVADAKRQARSLRQADNPVCHVDPGNPDRAVLERSADSINWFAFLFPLPFIFVVGGAFGLVLTWISVAQMIAFVRRWGSEVKQNAFEDDST